MTLTPRYALAASTATRLLSELGISEPPVDVLGVAHHIGAVVKMRPFDGDLSGMVARRAGRAVIGVNENHPETRQRFTIAHEIGHFLLHAEHGLHVDETFPIAFRNRTSSQAVDAREMEANQFAAALLMSEPMVRRAAQDCSFDSEDDAHVRELAKHFGVSAHAMTIRLTRFDFLR